MPRITLRVSQDMFERLQIEARALDREAERTLGQPRRRHTTAAAAVALLQREFERRDERARAARERRRA